MLKMEKKSTLRFIIVGSKLLRIKLTMKLIQYKINLSISYLIWIYSYRNSSKHMFLAYLKIIPKEYKDIQIESLGQLDNLRRK